MIQFYLALKKNLQRIPFVLLLLLSRFSRVRLCATPETAAHQAPPSLGFSEFFSTQPSKAVTLKQLTITSSKNYLTSPLQHLVNEPTNSTYYTILQLFASLLVLQ